MDVKDVEASGASSFTTVLASSSAQDTAPAAGFTQLGRQFHRVPSFGSTRIDPRTKIPGDFRTLRSVQVLVEGIGPSLIPLRSVHVTETQEAGTDLSKGKGNARGRSPRV